MSQGGHLHEHITHVGIQGGKLIPVSHVIQNIKDGHDYFVKDKDTGKDIQVHINSGGIASFKPYIQTKADGKFSNNLLALPDCT